MVARYEELEGIQLEDFVRLTEAKITPRTCIQRRITESIWRGTGQRHCHAVGEWTRTKGGWIREGKHVVLPPDVAHGLYELNDDIGQMYWVLEDAEGYFLDWDGYNRYSSDSAMAAVECALMTALGRIEFEALEARHAAYEEAEHEEAEREAAEHGPTFEEVATPEQVEIELSSHRHAASDEELAVDVARERELNEMLYGPIKE